MPAHDRLYNVAKPPLPQTCSVGGAQGCCDIVRLSQDPASVRPRSSSKKRHLTIAPLRRGFSLALGTDPSRIRHYVAMPSGALTIAELPGPVVEVHCPRCDRRGRYVREWLAERVGPNLSLPDLLRRLSPDCPVLSELCNQSFGAIYPRASRNPYAPACARPPGGCGASLRGGGLSRALGGLRHLRRSCRGLPGADLRDSPFTPATVWHVRPECRLSLTKRTVTGSVAAFSESAEVQDYRAGRPSKVAMAGSAAASRE